MNIEQIPVPAETWAELELAYSAHRFVEASAGPAARALPPKPVSVLATTYGGSLYTVLSILHAPLSNRLRPWIEAWLLVPAALYSGEKTLVYHDEKAVQAGLRARGDHTGLIVSVRGERMVCARSVRFLLDFPGTRPVSREEAEAHDRRQRSSGWRALWYPPGVEPEWVSLRGHPVAVYRGHRTTGASMAVLFWMHRTMRELFIGEDVLLGDTVAESASAPSRPLSMSGVQLALF